MYVLRNKKTRALTFLGNKKVILVYVNERDALTALAAYEGRDNKKMDTVEIVSVKLVKAKGD